MLPFSARPDQDEEEEEDEEDASPDGFAVLRMREQ